MASVTYGKSNMSSVIMAKILWQMKLSRCNSLDGRLFEIIQKVSSMLNQKIQHLISYKYEIVK